MAFERWVNGKDEDEGPNVKWLGDGQTMQFNCKGADTIAIDLARHRTRR